MSFAQPGMPDAPIIRLEKIYFSILSQLPHASDNDKIAIGEVLLSSTGSTLADLGGSELGHKELLEFFLGGPSSHSRLTVFGICPTVHERLTTSGPNSHYDLRKDLPGFITTPETVVQDGVEVTYEIFDHVELVRPTVKDALDFAHNYAKIVDTIAKRYMAIAYMAGGWD